MADGTLVQRALDGDKDAFSVLVERYRHQVYALAFYHTHNVEAAHDLAQEAFIQAYLKLSRLRDTGKFIAWLRALTTNLCRSWLRRSQVETVPLEASEAAELHDPQAAPYLAVERLQQESLVQEAMASLPERQRLAVTMFYMGGLSYQEIAEFLGESVNAVESRLHRARRHLQERMMTMIDESFKPHQLPGQFTDEVLQKVQAIQLEGMGPRQAAGRLPSVLLEDEKQRRFYIHLTDTEAKAILTKSTGEPLPRPLPQTMLQEIMMAFDITLEQVVLDDVRRGEFWAQLQVSCGGQSHSISARAGDALALAWGLNSSPQLLATKKALSKARRLEAARGERSHNDNDTEPTGAALGATSTSLLGAISTSLEEVDEQKERFNRQRTQSWARTDWQKQVPVTIQALTSDKRGSAMVVLEGSGGRTLFLWIGTAEGYSIKQGLEAGPLKSEVHLALPPLPENNRVAGAHDLIQSLLTACGVEMLWGAIDNQFQEIYYSVLALQRDGKLHYVDARPSDSMALAVRCGCPLFVSQEVMQGSQKEAMHTGDLVGIWKLELSAGKQPAEHNIKSAQIEFKADGTFVDETEILSPPPDYPPGQTERLPGVWKLDGNILERTFPAGTFPGRDLSSWTIKTLVAINNDSLEIAANQRDRSVGKNYVGIFVYKRVSIS